VAYIEHPKSDPPKCGAKIQRHYKRLLLFSWGVNTNILSSMRNINRKQIGVI
jgi:hypothetical protein